MCVHSFIPSLFLYQKSTKQCIGTLLLLIGEGGRGTMEGEDGEGNKEILDYIKIGRDSSHPECFHNGIILIVYVGALSQ